MKAGKDLAAREVLADLARWGVAALVPGDRDLGQGLAHYQRLVAEAKVPVLAANLVDAASGVAPFPAQRVVTAGSVRVGIVGVVGDKALKSVKDVRVGPIVPAAKKAIEAAKQDGAELIVLLSHASSHTLKKALAELTGVHLAIAGQDRSLSNRPVRVGETFVVGGGDRGRRVGHVELLLDKPPWKLADAGEPDVLQSEVSKLEKRIAYFRRQLDGKGAAWDKRRQLAERRLPDLETKLKTAQEALARAKATPVSGNRLRVLAPEMNEAVVDHAETKKRVATCTAQMAATGMAMHGGKRPGVGPRPRTPGSRTVARAAPALTTPTAPPSSTSPSAPAPQTEHAH